MLEKPKKVGLRFVMEIPEKISIYFYKLYLASMERNQGDGKISTTLV